MDVNKIGSERVQQERVSEQNATQKSQAGANNQTEAAGSGATKSDKSSGVNWSADAQMMTEGLAAAKTAPDVRADRVAQIKDAIRSGSYKMDAKKIADRMINESLADDLATRNG